MDVTENSAENLLRGLDDLRKDETFCDIALTVGEKTLKVHKVVISGSSPYFLAMFSGNFSESDQQEIFMKEIDGDCLEILIDFMYTGKLNMDSVNVDEVLLTASFLQITNAEEICRRFMENKSNEDNSIDISKNLLIGLNELRKNGTFCDVTLRAGGRTIRVHKVVISGSSPYFLAMFSGAISQSNQEEISITEIDPDSLELLIEYMYTGMLNIDSGNVVSILHAVSILKISNAEEICCNFVEDELNLENCFDYVIVAATYSIKSLLKMTLQMAVLAFHHLVSKNDYLKLQFEEFKQLTQMLKEKGHPEDMIFSSTIRWIRHDYETRKDFMEELLNLLHPSLVSPNILSSAEIASISNPILTAWTERDKAVRPSRDSGSHILLSRTIGTFQPLVIKFFSQAKHRQVEMLPEDITGGSYACNGYYIYHQGGWGTHEVLTDSYVYHPTKCVWVPFVPLQEPRVYHRSCVLNEKIFSVGGLEGFTPLSSVEFTDLYTGRGVLTNPMPRAKEQPGLGVHENSLYVVGGTDRITEFKCMQRFDEREGVWQELAPSPYEGGASSCAVLGDDIYTALYGSIAECTLQRYDIRANDWAKIPTKAERIPFEVFAVDNTLCGLFDDHVARFMPEENGGRWQTQRTWKYNYIFSHLHVSTNLLFPNLSEEIIDSAFDGECPYPDDDSEEESTEDESDSDKDESANDDTNDEN